MSETTFRLPKLFNPVAHASGLRLLAHPALDCRAGKVLLAIALSCTGTVAVISPEVEALKLAAHDWTGLRPSRVGRMARYQVPGLTVWLLQTPEDLPDHVDEVYIADAHAFPRLPRIPARGIIAGRRPQGIHWFRALLDVPPDGAGLFPIDRESAVTEWPSLARRMDEAEEMGQKIARFLTAARAIEDPELADPLVMADAPNHLTPRWTPLKPHPEQIRLVRSKCRFKVTAAGRRSGKTERAKRRLVIEALAFTAFPDGRFIAAAPTHPQARALFWDDLCALVPPEFVVGEPSESRLEIKLVNGAMILVYGMDKPARIEGSPIDGFIFDEFAESKRDAWPKHVRPALSTAGREGWAWIFGRPRGRNHFFELYNFAEAEQRRLGPESQWDGFRWFSRDIIAAEEVATAERELDPITFQEQFEAAFLSYAGVAYRSFDRLVNVRECRYAPNRQLLLGADFNNDPMTLTVFQWHPARDPRTDRLLDNDPNQGEIHILDETWCRSSSIEEAVATLAPRWAAHPGGWKVTPDPSGKNKTHSGFTDHTLLMQALKLYGFKGCVLNSLSSAPGVRDAVNVVNALLRSAAGISRLFIEPICKHLIEDLERCEWTDTTGKEISKKDPDRTHSADTIKYELWSSFRPDSFVREPNYEPGKVVVKA